MGTGDGKVRIATFSGNLSFGDGSFLLRLRLTKNTHVPHTTRNNKARTRYALSMTKRVPHTTHNDKP